LPAQPPQRSKIARLLLLLPWLLVVAAVFFDPGSFVEWFLD